MKKKLIIVCSVALTIVIASFVICAATKKSDDSIFAANVEALSDGENSLDTRYIREESTCSIHVGVGAKVKIFGLGILKPDVDGNITFDGHVVCGAGGTQSCSPVECRDLYEVIFN